MDAKNLLLFDNRLQVINAIEGAKDFGGEIWQTSSLGRSLFHVIQITTDFTHQKVTFKVLNPETIDPASPFYIKLCYRNIIFKVSEQDFNLQKDKIICKIPSEIRALPPRPSLRYALPFQSDISLSLKRGIRSIKETVLDLEVRILDVSEKGFGIMISGVNRNFLKQHDYVCIKKIDHQNLYNYLYGKVTYVSSKGYFLKRGDVRVGLSLEESIDHDIFEYLKKRSLLKLSA